VLGWAVGVAARGATMVFVGVGRAVADL